MDNNKTIKIGIDLDGVVTNFIQAFAEILNELYGLPLNVDYNTIQEYDIKKWLEPNLTPAQLDIAWDKAKTTYNWWRHKLNPMRDDAVIDCLKLINFLDNVGVVTYFITNRPETHGNTVVTQAAAWLHAKGVRHPQVINVENKGAVCKALGISFFIDDKPSNLDDIIRDCGDSCKVFLKTVGHNKKSTVSYPRVDSIGEFFDEVLASLK